MSDKSTLEIALGAPIRAVMSGELSDFVLDYQLETLKPQSDGSRHVTHVIHDPDQPPSALPRTETWKSEKRPIGKGSQGLVFKQMCTAGPGHYDLRAVRIIPHGRQSLRKRFSRELETMVRFSHRQYAKYFVRMLGWYLLEENLCVAMEYLPEGNLETYVRTESLLSEAEARNVIGQVVQGLVIMHKRGYSHRDINPKNVLIQRKGSSEDPASWWIKLADFGISKRIDTTITTMDGPVGTIEFMAPELLDQTETQSQADYKAADIWAVGVMAFYVLTGLPGFRKRRIDFENTQSLSPDHNISSEGLDFILKLTLHHPDERVEVAKASAHAWIDHHIPELPASQPTDVINESSSEPSSPETTTSDYQGRTTVPSNVIANLSNIPRRVPVPKVSVSELEATSTNAAMAAANSSGTFTATELDATTTVTKETTTALEVPPAFPIELDSTSVPLPTKSPAPSSVPSVSAAESASQHTIHTAASKGLLERTMQLVKSKVNIEAWDPRGVTPLIAAAYNGHIEVAMCLLDNWASIEARSKPCFSYEPRLSYDDRFIVSYEGLMGDGVTPLLAAASRGHFEMVKQLHVRSAELRATSVISNVSSLHWAALIGHHDMVDFLLRRGVDVNASTKWGSRPLHVAASRGHAGIVKLLVERGASPEPRTTHGVSPLHAAAANNHAGIVKQLVEGGAGVEPRTMNGKTPLYGAASKGHTATVKQLIELGANVNITTNLGGTALMGAAVGGHLQVVESLISSGADIHALDSNGCSSAIVAADNGHVYVVKYLDDKGADVQSSKITIAGTTYAPLHLAVVRGHTSLAVFLCERGANIMAPDSKGRTSLELAILYERFEIVKLLAERGADFNQPMSDGQMPIVRAAFDGNLEIIKVLDGKVDNLMVPGREGSTALHEAVACGHLEVVQYLIERKVDLSVKNKKGCTPLLVAARYGFVVMVELLAGHGADITSPDLHGRTPLYWAASEGFLETIEYLAGKGASLFTSCTDKSTAFIVSGFKRHTEAAKLLNDLQTKQVLHSNLAGPVAHCEDVPYKPFPKTVSNLSPWSSYNEYIYNKTTGTKFAVTPLNHGLGRGRNAWILHNGEKPKDSPLVAGEEISNQTESMLYSLDSVIYLSGLPGTAEFVKKRDSRVVLRAGLGKHPDNAVIFRYMMRTGIDLASNDLYPTSQQDFEWRFSSFSLSGLVSHKWQGEMSLYRLQGPEVIELDAIAPDMAVDREVINGPLATLKMLCNGSKPKTEDFTFDSLRLPENSPVTVLAFSTALTIWYKMTAKVITTTEMRECLGLGKAQAGSITTPMIRYM